MNRTRIHELMAQQPEISETIEDARSEDVESEEFGMPEEDLTHAIDVTAVLAEKRKSMAAHASQISEADFFLTYPQNAEGLEEDPNVDCYWVTTTPTFLSAMLP